MSNLLPFEAGVSGAPIPQDPSSDVFKPDLRDFDWIKYKDRQAQINNLLLNGDEEGIGSLLHQMHLADPNNGVMLNNLHGTTIKGTAIQGLHAPLSVLSRSVLKIGLPNLNFSGGVAAETGFSGQNLAGANFVNSVLTRSQFERTNLKGADFTNAVLNGVNFKDADVEGTDFTGAYLIDVFGLSEEQVRQMKLQATRTVIMAPSNGSTSLEQLLSSRFGEAASLEDLLKFLDPVPVAVNEESGQPIGRLQAKRILRGLYAKNANWSQADFTSADLTGSMISGLQANQASFRAATVGGMVIKSAVMREVDMVSTWAPGIVLEDVDLRDANFTKANLVGAVLGAVDLRGAIGLSDNDTNTEGLVIAEDCLLPRGYGYDGGRLQMSQKLKRELET